MYADSSLVKANVNSHQLSRSGLTVEEFRQRAIDENGAASDHYRGNLRIVGSAGMGEVEAKRIVGG